MTPIRLFSRVGEDGKIAIPPNIKRGMGLKKDQLVELRLAGTCKKRSLVMTARDNAR